MLLKESIPVLPFLVFNVLFGVTGILDAGAKQEGFEHLHQNELRGVLLEIPLRKVLTQLKDHLGVDYVVPEEELDTPVSVSLSGESLIEALPKILSGWDYAIQTNQHGQVQRIFVLKKSSTDYSVSGDDPRTIDFKTFGKTGSLTKSDDQINISSEQDPTTIDSDAWEEWEERVRALPPPDISRSSSDFKEMMRADSNLSFPALGSLAVPVPAELPTPRMSPMGT